MRGIANWIRSTVTGILGWLLIMTMGALALGIIGLKVCYDGLDWLGDTGEDA